MVNTNNIEDELAKRRQMHSLNPQAFPFVPRASDTPMTPSANDPLASKLASVVEDPSKDPTSPRPSLPGACMRYSGRLDETRGPLRTTSDGNLLEEESGDWLVLDTPPHDTENRELATRSSTKAAKVPVIGLPESKNGATGLDNPRARKSLSRLFKNKWTGSDRLPTESLDPVMMAKQEVQTRAKKALVAEGDSIDIDPLDGIQQGFGSEIATVLGDDSFEHALVDKVAWKQVLQATLKITL